MIEDIKEPILKEFSDYKDKMNSYFVSGNKIMDFILTYISKQSGKELRPLMTILSSAVCGNVSDETLAMACSLEMLHQSSLLHDDVVDESNYRRSSLSSNALWNNKPSVLVGDYLVSLAANIAAKLNDRKMILLLTGLGILLSQGEIYQLENQQKEFIKVDDYIKVIRYKTAETFSACTYSGAILAGALEEQAEALKKFGLIFGLMFQIKDDIIDYSNEKVGKPTGLDIREGKITLPLILSLKKSGNNKEIRNIIRNKNFSEVNVAKINQFVKDFDGVGESYKFMEEYREEAISCLNIFSDNKYKSSLIKVLDLVFE